MTETRRYCIITFGCQMNVYDSGRLASSLEERGWEEAPSREEADFVFLNTCSVREKAVQRVVARLRELAPLKRRRPGTVIGVGGCAAEQEGLEFVRLAPAVDIVAGPARLAEIPAALDAFSPGDPPRVLVGDAPAEAPPDPGGASPAGAAGAGPEPPGQPSRPRRRRRRGPLILPPLGEEGPAPLSAFLTVMEGCDNFCAYCVVPGLRGPERSRPPEDVLAEARSLVSRGAREITLLGQNVNSYRPAGAPAGERGGRAFVRLLADAAAIPGLWRLRFTTSHPKDFPPELPRLMAGSPVLCPHVHLPLQAGSDRVLGLMGRGYTAAGFLAILEGLRREVPGVAVTTDIIAGFPGETEEDFRETLRVLGIASFDSAFSFRYSDRPGTRALSMPGKIPDAVKARRLSEIIALQRAISLRVNRALEGIVQEVLVAGFGREPGQVSGRTGTNKIVNFPGDPGLVGSLARVRIVGSGPVSLRGGPLSASPVPSQGDGLAAAGSAV
ncbi:MAG: MiaB/RimO family radical SAM methylthiotransferase [Deltaproteobacteria bacterium]|jgi:tRNA-2-methylthio-N6-dimethylallyladenosine synthase|nr:MiaB/RimO family radical SAM methylthiotransferase [Deltaproteobacteria bacterium]